MFSVESRKKVEKLIFLGNLISLVSFSIVYFSTHGMQIMFRLMKKFLHSGTWHIGSYTLQVLDRTYGIFSQNMEYAIKMNVHGLYIF